MSETFTYDLRVDLDEYAKETAERFSDLGRRMAARVDTALMKALNPDFTHLDSYERLEAKRIG